MRKSAIYNCASTFIHVLLDPPCKRASEVYLQAPRTSYSSRRSHVARPRKTELDWSGSSKNPTQSTPFVVVLALIFPSHHKPFTPLHQSELRWDAPWRCCSGANLRVECSRSRTPRNARRYCEKVPVVLLQFASGGADV